MLCVVLTGAVLSCVPGQPAAVRVYTDAEQGEAARYASEVKGGCADGLIKEIFGTGLGRGTRNRHEAMRSWGQWPKHFGRAGVHVGLDGAHHRSRGPDQLIVQRAK